LNGAVVDTTKTAYKCCHKVCFFRHSFQHFPLLFSNQSPLGVENPLPIAHIPYETLTRVYIIQPAFWL